MNIKLIQYIIIFSPQSNSTVIKLIEIRNYSKMGLLSKILKVNGTVMVGGAAFTAY